ncbi:MAG: hypothetical protein COT34_01065 [Candidatus Nealsonbacteria bacterium CG08_land_8_20_14_0_20_43_11]|uniref:Uncharacterized protein n=1 Tax=Candidatus Nealsonbacteria bacterium CG08_land_8_20_14_0_20_43_11 TaxID=1974706 RepID=A0A2M6T0W8_9BACT|nr:MAG: hypothetical protein COT34_01065 [Candidatus Nealsonbacteria bacterium CG08_land_8_20_14_0_20_43_11]
MAEIAEKKIIFVQLLSWYLAETPKRILAGWKNFLAFGLDFFSVPLLFKTFFSYWRRYRWFYPRGFDFSKYGEVFFSNLISRFLGASVRVVFIILGILAEILIFSVGLVVFLGWFVLPLIVFAGLFFGLGLLFF